MPQLLGLPSEILLWIFGSLNGVRDAVHLSQCCKILGRLFNQRGYQAKILESIVIGHELPFPKTPDSTWLEAHFGAGSLWIPTESELPVKLIDAKTRKFLTDVGFPSVQCTSIEWDSRKLKKEANAGKDLYAFEVDEIFFPGWPDEEPPFNFCYELGRIRGEYRMLIGAEKGDIIQFDEGGYDEDAYRGLIATSIPSLLVLFGTMVTVMSRMGERPQELSDEAFVKTRQTILCQVRKRMADYHGCLEEGSYFWDEMFRDWAELDYVIE